MAEKKSSQSQLAKTQKIPVYEPGGRAPGIYDSEARKLVEEYKRISSVLKWVKKYNPANPLIFILIKKKLSSLVQQEFELYKSFPEIVKNKKMASSVGVVSSYIQRDLAWNSDKVFSKLDTLIQERLLKRKFMEEVYSFKLPPVRVPQKAKKSANVFTSSSMKKKFY